MFLFSIQDFLIHTDQFSIPIFKYLIKQIMNRKAILFFNIKYILKRANFSVVDFGCHALLVEFAL